MRCYFTPTSARKKTSVGENVQKQEPSAVVGENVVKSPWKKSLAVPESLLRVFTNVFKSFKLSRGTLLHSSPRNLPTRTKNLGPRKDLLTMFTTALFLRPRLETTCTHQRADRQKAASLYKGMLLGWPRGEQSTHGCCTKDPQKRRAKWKRSDTKDHIRCTAVYVKCPEEVGL